MTKKNHGKYKLEIKSSTPALAGKREINLEEE